MAAPGSAFKVKCPSCEAGVTIRDPSLAGKKVDCPKCKFRFVVELPSEEGSAAAETKPVKKAPTAAVKSTAKTGDEEKSSKGKPLPKREDDDGAEKKKKKKSGSNMTLIIGGGIGVLAIAVLAIAYFAGLFGDSSTPPPKQPPPQQQVAAPKDKVSKGVEPTKGTDEVEPPKKEVPKEPPPDPVYGNITNMLPPDADWVMLIPGPELVKTPMGAVLFDESGDSAKAFKRWMGFAGTDIERFACAGDKDGGFFGVLRFQKDVKIEDLQAAMELDAQTRTIGKRVIHPIKSNELFKMLGEYLPTKIGAMGLPLPKLNKSAPLNLSLLDSRTLLIADQANLDQYFKDNLKRKFKTTYLRPGEDTPKDKKDNVVKKDQPMKNDPEKKDSRPSFTSNPSFLTVDPGLKIMMNQLEDDRTPVFSIAYKMPNFAAVLKQLSTRPAPAGLSAPPAPLVGLAVRELGEKKLDVVCAIEFEKSQDAVLAALGLQPEVHGWARLLSEVLRVPIGVGTGDPNMPIIHPKAMNQRGTDGSALAGAEERNRVVEAFQLVRPLPKKEGDNPGNTDPNVVLTSYISASASDKFLMIKLDVDWAPIYHQQLSPKIRAGMDLLKGEALMMTGRAHWHALPIAINLLEKAGAVPLAAIPRPPDPARFGAPYPPEQQVSWMVELLPALGYDPLSRQVRRDEAWNSDANLSSGTVCIPEFLSRENPPPTWRAQPPSLRGRELAATHFVGLSGIGMDAANYPDTPEYKNKLGMFGYNRQAKFADVADGLSNTIFMIQVPPNIQRPWIRGGGSTVQGVPEAGSVKPFVSVKVGDKKGTYALMADGSIRFVSDAIEDKVFQGLTTYKGGEKIDKIDQLAPAIKQDAKLTAPVPDPKAESPK